MVIGDAVVGNRVTYTCQGSTLPGIITAINGSLVQVLCDRDVMSGQVIEVDPSTLSLNTDGGYFGSLQGIQNYQS